MIEKISDSLSNSEGMNELLSRKRGFIEKWALSLFLALLILLIIGTWFIHYPDIIRARANLIATNTPKEIVTRQDGKIIKLFFKNGDSVEEGQTIAWIESSANHSHVEDILRKVDTCLDYLKQNRLSEIKSIFSGEERNLGELQAGFEEFMKSYREFSDYWINRFYLNRKKILVDEKRLMERKNQSLQEEIDLLNRDLKLSKDEFDATDTLYLGKVVSKQELRNNESKVISKMLNIPQLNVARFDNQETEIQKEKELQELDHAYSQSIYIFEQAAETFRSSIYSWEKRFFLMSPAKGKVVFLTPIQINQYVKEGKVLGFVNPQERNFYAELNLQQNNFGKIDLSKEIQLRFDAYPFTEFGSVKGEFRYISSIATDSGFIAQVTLPNGLITDHGREIQFKPGLTAEAIIVTKDLRLLQKFYQTILKTTKQ